MSLKIGSNLQNYCTINQDGSVVFDKEFPYFHKWNLNADILKDVVKELEIFLEDVSKNCRYIQIVPGENPLMRDGSIGNIQTLDTILLRLNRLMFELNSGVFSIDIDFKIRKCLKLEIKFDKKHSSGFFTLDKLKFLDGYNGPTVYINEKNDILKKEIILKDKFDNDLKEGSFICFATSTSRQQGIAMFGKITSIKNENLFYAKNIKLAENDHSREYVLRYPNDVILMNDELMDNITMARLSI